MRSPGFWRLIAIILVSSLYAPGQTLPPTTADDQMGTQPFQSYHGGGIDHIGLSNGTLSLDYPFLAYSQRGSLQLSFHLYYNNQPQHMAEECVPDPTPTNPNNQKCFFQWNWVPIPSPLPREKGDVFVGWAQQMAFYPTDSVVTLGSGSGATHYHYSNWSIQMADGSKHPLGDLGSFTFTGSAPDVYAVAGGPFATLDATGWRVNGSLTTDDYGSSPPATSSIVSPDGVIGGTQDPNGNMIGATLNGATAPMATAFTDTLGRQISAPPTAASASNAGTTACPSGALPVDHAVLWSVPGPSGGSSNYTFCYAVVATNMPPPTNAPYLGIVNQTKLQSIVLPDGHSWNFQYSDPGDGSTYNNAPVNYGTLTQITLPTGGTISYAYSTLAAGSGLCQNSGRFVASRTVNANDGTGSHTWTYAYSTTNTGVTTSPWSVATTVTDPLNNQTVHTFNSLYAQDNCPAYEAKTQYYQSGGTLLKTVTTAYSFTAGDNKNGPLNVVPTQITTAWAANGLTATVNKTYDSGFTYTNFKGSTGLSGIYGKELSESASDYGNNSAGATLKTTKTSYQAFSNSSYLTANLLNLVSSKSAADGSSCTHAETDYSYDESNYLTSYSGTLPSGTHGAPPNSVRGNPTTVTQQLFAANSCPTTAQSGLISHTNWYDTGEVYQTIDPLGNTTTHSYDAFYAGAYSTKTCNALSQCVSGTYDFNTGLLTSFTDANGGYQASGNTPGDPAHTTTLQYNDPLWRLTQIQSAPDPNGNRPTTTIKHPDANTVERLKTITTSLTDDSFGYFDGVGRHYKSVHSSAGNATVVTGYDADGRTASVTNPYFKPTDTTYGVTSTQYDGIGRVTQVTKQDSSVVTTQYNQTASVSTNADCALTTDEAGNPRQTCNDGLGRLIEVDEPGAASAGTDASGSVTVNGTLGSAVVWAHGAIQATGSVSISGSEQSKVITLTGQPCPGHPTVHTCTSNVTVYDRGTITVTVNGASYSSAFGQNWSASLIAQTIASNMGNDTNVSVVSVTNPSSTSSVINLQARNAGSSGNSITIGSSYTYDSTDFSSPSFTTSPTSGNLSNGQDAFGGTTIYDSGTVNMTVGSFSASACYGPSGSCAAVAGCATGASTASQIACALTSSGNSNGLNRSGSPVSASASGSSIAITYTTPGTAGNVAVSITSSSSNSSQFPGGSFSGSGSLSGGANPYASGIAHPYVTLYSYDVLGNLLSVTQKGGTTDSTQWRVRTFTYDSLSRLLTATNPESGQISYSYDADGNMLQKTSPMPNQTGTATQTISYCYDKLNRLTGKAYSAQSCPLNSPVVSWGYDSSTNGVGRLTSLTDQAGSGTYTYDALGWITSEQRTIAGIKNSLSYTYNLDSSVATLTYPSGAVVTYTPDAAGRMLSAVDVADQINYVTTAAYGPDNSLTGFVSGNSSSFSGITSSWQYNPRLQVCRITALTSGTLPTSCTDSADKGNVLDLGYNLNSGSDNGNVLGITNYKDPTRNQTFTYDTLNRLISAQNAGTDCTKTTLNPNQTEYWGDSYSYDPWGNLLQKNPTKCKAEGLAVIVAANNQIIVAIRQHQTRFAQIRPIISTTPPGT